MIEKVLSPGAIKRAEKNGKLVFLKNRAIELMIGERYTEGEQIALLRQKDKKPDEYAAMDEFCEGCKAIVKERIKEVTGIDV